MNHGVNEYIDDEWINEIKSYWDTKAIQDRSKGVERARHR